MVETEEGGYEVLYQLYDARGSATSRIDSEGVLQKGTEYDAFGNRQEETGEEPELEDRMSYTGAEYEETTGLYYMNARHYDPETGRFLQQDTYRGSMYNAVTQHLYAYCGNNPVNMVDPTGHVPTFIDIIEEFGRKLKEIVHEITSKFDKETLHTNQVESSIRTNAYLNKTMSAKEIEALLEQDEVRNAIDSLAKIWANSEQGMYTEQELAEALAPHLSTLTSNYKIEFGILMETKEDGTSEVRMFNTGNLTSVGFEGMEKIKIEENSVISTLHSHSTEWMTDDGNSWDDVEWAYNNQEVLTGNSYVVKGDKLYVDKFEDMKNIIIKSFPLYDQNTFHNLKSYQPYIAIRDGLVNNWMNNHSSSEIFIKNNKSN